jgi:putative transposase
MKYNPQKHHRRSIRLKGYDYSQAGLYFITICCQERICRFGHIDDGEMILNGYGQIAYNEWTKLPERFPNFELDVFQIMPNHIHGIIILNEIPVGAGFTPAQNENAAQNVNDTDNRATDIGATDIGATDIGATDIGATDIGATDIGATDIGATARVAPTISDIVGAYKSLVANECLKIFKMNNETMGKLWQRNYYEHIIRNQISYIKISDYIINNPASWDNDSLK